MSDAEAKQRLMSVIVGEVSLVDRPANEEEFIMMKAIEESGKTGAEALAMLDDLVTKSSLDEAAKAMLRKAITDTARPAVAAAPVSKAELDPNTALAVTLNALQSVLWSVGDKLRDGDLATANTDMERIKIMLTAAAAHAQDAETVTKAIADFVAAVNKAAGAEDDKDEKGEGKDKPKKPVPPWMKEEMKKLAETLKGMFGDEDAAVILQSDGSVVAKGLKQFSKDRISKLKDSLKSLATMVKEIDGDGFAEILAGFTAPATAGALGTAGATPAAAVTPAPAPVAKAEEVPAWAKGLQESFTGLTKSLEAIGERVASVEKGTAVSKALGGDGTDKVEKKAGGFWTGVL